MSVANGGEGAVIIIDGADQSASTIVMVPPAHFEYNPQTAVSNRFQRRPRDLGIADHAVRPAALAQFSHMVQTLRSADVEVIELAPTSNGTPSPDAVFPNNWFSHHRSSDPGGTILLYPMLTTNRRTERRPKSLVAALRDSGRADPAIVDLSTLENAGSFLEGTGSLVLDRRHRVAFALQSARTTVVGLEAWCTLTGYTHVLFHASDGSHCPVYHTNVAMSVGSAFAVVCADAITDPIERQTVIDTLAGLGKDVIELSIDQMHAFCANLLELRTQSGDVLIVLSETARQALDRDQMTRLSRHGAMLPVDISVIEAVGGGSARCMIAEIF